jgi:uncharacterized protein YecT (DUF1311 family)
MLNKLNALKKTFIIFILIAKSCLTFSQTKRVTELIENKYQNCLDKGQNMLECSQTFYKEADSILNVAFKRIRQKCDSAQKENLKDEQLEWLSKRDIAFKKNKNEVSKETETKITEFKNDENMMLLDKNANMVIERTNRLFNAQPKDYSPENYKVSLTGFYDLDSKTENKNDDVFGYMGQILVKAIDNDKIVINLNINRGAPSYNMGILVDTIEVKNNQAIYETKEKSDGPCKLIFTFYRRGLKIDHIAEDYNFSCGFGHAVIANGFYKRKSNKTPTDKELKENQ